MKAKLFIYVLLLSNFSFGQTQVLIDNVWRLDKFVINGSDVTYSENSNHFHEIVFQNGGDTTALVSGYCETLFGLVCEFNGNQFSYEIFYSYGLTCNFNNDDVMLLITNSNFYFNNNINTFSYVINQLENVKQLIITNSSNNTAIYYSVDLGQEKFEISNNLVIYPNPVDNNLHFKSDFEIIKIKIFALDGKLIDSNLSFSGNQIDFSNIKSGIYFLEFEQDGQVTRKKVVKR